MHREDNSKFLLYIEPKKEQKSKEPVDDYITKVLRYAIRHAEKGTSNYGEVGKDENFQKGSGFKGWHTTDCGEHSSNNDYLLENGMITNSLAPFYLEYYRDAIPESEMKKVHELIEYYKSNEYEQKVYEYLRDVWGEDEDGVYKNQKEK